MARSIVIVGVMFCAVFLAALIGAKTARAEPEVMTQSVLPQWGCKTQRQVVLGVEKHGGVFEVFVKNGLHIGLAQGPIGDGEWNYHVLHVEERDVNTGAMLWCAVSYQREYVGIGG